MKKKYFVDTPCNVSYQKPEDFAKSQAIWDKSQEFSMSFTSIFLFTIP